MLFVRLWVSSSGRPWHPECWPAVHVTARRDRMDGWGQPGHAAAAPPGTDQDQEPLDTQPRAGEHIPPNNHFATKL